MSDQDKAALAQQAVPSCVWVVENRTSFGLFATKADADAFLSKQPPSVAGGMHVGEIPVIGAAPAAPCDAGPICIGCSPRNSDGSCPDAAPQAEQQAGQAPAEEHGNLIAAAKRVIAQGGAAWFSEQQLADENGLGLDDTEAAFIALCSPAAVLTALESQAQPKGTCGYCYGTGKADDPDAGLIACPQGCAQAPAVGAATPRTPEQVYALLPQRLRSVEFAGYECFSLNDVCSAVNAALEGKHA